MLLALSRMTYFACYEGYDKVNVKKYEVEKFINILEFISELGHDFNDEVP